MFITSLYIFKRLCVSIGILAAILVILLWLTQSLRFIEVIVDNSVSIQGYFSLIIYLLPDLFVKVVPVCTLIGALLIYSKLTLDNELQVMQAVGKSPWQIALPGLSIATFFTITLLLFNIFVIPEMFRTFRAQELRLRNQFSTSLVREGGFNVVKGLTVFVEKRINPNSFKGVFIHNNGGVQNHSGKQEAYTIMAQKGFLKKIDKDEYALILHDGVRQEKNEQNVIQSITFKELVYCLDGFTNGVHSRSLKPYERDLSELFQLRGEKAESEKQRVRFATEAHQRLLLPFLCILNVMFVVLVMIVNRPSRRLRRRRMATLVFGGILFQWLVLNLLQIQLTFKYGVFLAYFITLCCLLCGFVYIKNGQLHYSLQKFFEKCGI